MKHLLALVLVLLLLLLSSCVQQTGDATITKPSENSSSLATSNSEIAEPSDSSDSTESNTGD